jgi:hypothetical protein
MEVAASARFGSVAVVADLALEALTGGEPKSERVPVIRTPEQLREVRDAWRRKLGLQQEPASQQPPE